MRYAYAAQAPKAPTRKAWPPGLSMPQTQNLHKYLAEVRGVPLPALAGLSAPGARALPPRGPLRLARTAAGEPRIAPRPAIGPSASERARPVPFEAAAGQGRTNWPRVRPIRPPCSHRGQSLHVASRQIEGGRGGGVPRGKRCLYVRLG